MNTIARMIFGLSVACFALSALFAAEAQAAPKGRKVAQRVAAFPPVFKLPDAIVLTAEQQAKIDELKTKYSDKLREAVRKVDEIYTDEQHKAMRGARKAAVTEGKKGKQLKAAVEAAVQLSPEQQQKMADARKVLTDLQKEVRKQVVGLLTDDQKEHIKVKAKKA